MDGQLFQLALQSSPGVLAVWMYFMHRDVRDTRTKIEAIQRDFTKHYGEIQALKAVVDRLNGDDT